MGYCQKASLAWGFKIPDDKLYDLLRCLKKHDPKLEEENKVAEEEAVKAKAKAAAKAAASASTPTPISTEASEAREAKRPAAAETEGEPKTAAAPPQKKKRKRILDDCEAEELGEYLEEIVGSEGDFGYILSNDPNDKKQYATLAFYFQGIYGEDGEDFDPYSIETWGYDKGGEIFKEVGSGQPHEAARKEMEEPLQKLYKDLHFEEACILPIKEEWILSLNCG